jgi:hypothetical protein
MTVWLGQTVSELSTGIAQSRIVHGANLRLILVLSGDGYVNTHATLFRQSVRGRREGTDLFHGARGYRRREQPGAAILLTMALGSSASDQQHDVGRDRLGDLDAGMKRF